MEIFVFDGRLCSAVCCLIRGRLALSFGVGYMSSKAASKVTDSQLESSENNIRLIEVPSPFSDVLPSTISLFEFYTLALLTENFELVVHVLQLTRYTILMEW